MSDNTVKLIVIISATLLVAMALTMNIVYAISDRKKSNDITNWIFQLCGLVGTMILMGYYFFTWNVFMIGVLPLILFSSIMLGMYMYASENRSDAMDWALFAMGIVNVVTAVFLLFLVWIRKNQIQVWLKGDEIHFEGLNGKSSHSKLESIRDRKWTCPINGGNDTCWVTG